MTKEEIIKKLQEDPSYTLPDDATDEEWDIYLEVKNNASGNKEEEELDEPDNLEDEFDDEL